MKKKNIISVMLAAALIFSGCESESDVTDKIIQISDSAEASELTSESTLETELYTSAEKNNNEADTTVSAETPAVTTEETAASLIPAVTTADTSGMDFSFEEEDVSKTIQDYGTKIDVEASAEESYEITSGGSYTFSGTKKDVMITVDAKNADVNIILDGVTINNSNGPAIYVRKADKVTITLADGTVNTLSDGSSYSLTDGDTTLDAVIFSKADLTINGSGILNLTGNYKHGVVSKDDLVISSGTFNITSADVGLNGKDCVKINDGDITINAGSDAIRSDNDEDTSKGYIYIYGGKTDITAANDGIQAETVINIENTNLSIVSGGGSGKSLTSSEESYKGLKAGSDIYISGGVFDINSQDDCIHSNGTITVSGGSYMLSSGDDGVHADTDLAISGGSTSLTITKSYEGVEATNIIISDGDISITASDDGINAAGGNDSSSMDNGRFGRGGFSSSTGTIVISGGDIYIKASGDGIDSNGTLDITGGNIVVSGPTKGDTSILDYDTIGKISGGTFIGTGSSSMAQCFNSAEQGVIAVNTNNHGEGTVITLTDASGNVILTRTADQSFNYVILSSPDIAEGGTYTLTVGSETTEIVMDGTIYGSGGDFGMGGFGMGGFGGGIGDMPGGGNPDFGGNRGGGNRGNKR
ncbi:MAG: carbohydrate-binding domain-containing protein [Oscillospiraceae bacterium]|nr:carbohydrate-binding domain-containing protein [Oscillospiraceae bacterium]